MQDREHEPEVGRDRRLAREQVLDALLDREVAGVHLVVEADHFLGELGVAVLERGERRAERAQHEVAFRLEIALHRGQLLVKARPHPKRPVT